MGECHFCAKDHFTILLSTVNIKTTWHLFSTLLHELLHVIIYPLPEKLWHYLTVQLDSQTLI
jgi:hypothetical protein